MTGPRPPGRWVSTRPSAWILGQLRRRPRLYRAVYLVWAVVRSLPYVFGSRDPSQFGEGRLLVEAVPRDGRFLDIGCYEPVRFNNTWMLRRRGWRGWSVDASAFHRPLWRVLRPRDRLLHLAVVAQPGVHDVELFQFQPEYSGMSTLSVERVQSIRDRGHDHRATSVVVPARHIRDLLDDFEAAWGRAPELLLTDVEGLDWDLIEAVGLAELRTRGVRFLLLEDLGPVTDGGGGSALDLERLREAGWAEIGRTHLSVLFTSSGA